MDDDHSHARGQLGGHGSIQRSVVLNLQSRPDVTKYVWAAW